jgi:hypothetical protein
MTITEMTLVRRYIHIINPSTEIQNLLSVLVSVILPNILLLNVVAPLTFDIKSNIEHEVSVRHYPRNSLRFSEELEHFIS